MKTQLIYERLEDAMAGENKVAYRLWEVLVEVAELECIFWDCKKCVVCLAKRYVKEHGQKVDHH